MPDSLPYTRLDSDELAPRCALRTAGALAEPPVRVLQADGFVVVCRWRDPQSVVPPYKTSYTYDHHKHLSDALEAWDDYERGEHPAFTPLGIFAAKGGLPIGAAMDPDHLSIAMSGTEKR